MLRKFRRRAMGISCVGPICGRAIAFPFQVLANYVFARILAPSDNTETVIFNMVCFFVLLWIHLGLVVLCSQPFVWPFTNILVEMA